MNHRGSASRLRTRLVSCRSGCSHTNGTGSVGMRPGAASTVLSRVSSLSVYPILPAPRCWWFYKIPTTLKKYIVASPQLIDASSLLSSAHPPRTWTPGGSVRALDHLPKVHQEHQRRWKMMMHILICTWLPLTVCPTYSGVQHKKEKKKTFLVMINVLHFRVHDNKTFMQNHFKAQRLIPQPASLARLASGYIYALLSGKRSSSFGWSRQMEGFIPYSKHFFFLLFFCLTKCTSHYFSFSLSRVLPSSNSDSHHWNSVSRRSFLSLSLFLSMGWYLQSEIQPNSSPCPERLVCVSPRWSTRLISCWGR